MNSNVINILVNAKKRSERFARPKSTKAVVAPSETDMPALTDHPFPGPFLTPDGNGTRCRSLQRRVFQLEAELGRDHPQIALVRSWYAVSHCAECFDEPLLDMRREAEPDIRAHYPEAHWALAMNLAAQGWR